MRYLGVPFVELLPETAGWMPDGGPVSPRTWLGTVGRYPHAIAYGELFWPEFAERGGRVYLSDPGVPDADLPSEALANHRHVADLFLTDGGTPEQLRYVGMLLRDMWTAKLARDFPGRRFVVDFPAGPCECDLDYIVSFWEEPPPDAELGDAPDPAAGNGSGNCNRP